MLQYILIQFKILQHNSVTILNEITLSEDLLYVI